MKRFILASIVGVIGTLFIVVIGPDQSAALDNGFIRLLTCGITLVVVIFLALLAQSLTKGGSK